MYYEVSTGIRFTTLPDATPPSFQLPSPTSSPLSAASQRPSPSQPPTTITALFNPMLGHISSAYAQRVTRNLSLCSRFDFNVYSYESEWAIGSEWWIRRGLARSTEETEGASSESHTGRLHDAVHGVVKARASTTTVSVLSAYCSCGNSYQAGRVAHVGGPHPQSTCELGRSVKLVESFKTYQSYRVRALLL